MIITAEQAFDTFGRWLRAAERALDDRADVSMCRWTELYADGLSPSKAARKALAVARLDTPAEPLPYARLNRKVGK